MITLKDEKTIFFEKNLNFNTLNFSFPQETCDSCSSSTNNNPIYLNDLEKSVSESISQIEEINSKKIRNILDKINNSNTLNDNIDNKEETLFYNEKINKYLEYTIRQLKEKNEKEEEKINKNEILLLNSSENYSQLICSICNNGDIDHNQLMYECESCGLTVHQNCYGIKGKSLTNWICDPCKEMSKEEALNLECILCPVKGGAMKKIELPYDSHFYNDIMEYRKSNGQNIPIYNSHIIIPFDKYDNIKCAWVHLSCALWNPNIEIGIYDEKKEIKNVDRIEYCKFSEKCNICNKKYYGPVLKCNHDNCKFYFHPECARINHFCMEVEAIEQDLKYNIYCFQHYQNSLVKTIEKNQFKNTKEINEFNHILLKIISNYQKKYHFNILSKNFINCENSNVKGEYSILNVNKKKFIITLKKENFISDYYNKHQLRIKNKNLDVFTKKKNNNYKKLISINISGNKNIRKNKTQIIKLKKNSELLYLSRLRKICREYSKYNNLVIDKNIIMNNNNNNNSGVKRKKKKNNKKKRSIISYSLNKYYDLYSLLKYEDLLSTNFPWDKIHFKNFSKEKCKQYFLQLIPNESVFNNKIKYYSKDKNENNKNNSNNNIIGFSINDDYDFLDSDSMNVQNIVEIKIDNVSKENEIDSL